MFKMGMIECFISHYCWDKYKAKFAIHKTKDEKNIKII